MTASAATAATPVTRAWERATALATVVSEAGRLEIRAQRHPARVIQGIVQPASLLLVAVFAGRRAGGVDIEAAAIGAGLIAIWSATVWASGGILRGERWQGTLSQIVARPIGLAPVLIGKTLGATLRSALFIAATVAVTAAALGHPLEIARPVQFAAALAAILVSALVLGFLLSCLFVLTRAAGRISEALMYPVFILGGLLVPLALLPEWVRPVSTIVSLRWGAELLQDAAAGADQSIGAWVALAGTTAAYALLARILFRRVIDRSRREGTLDLH